MIVNAAEHAWVLGDDRFPLDKEVAVCPNHFPEREQSGHDLLASMQDHGVDRTVISHVCYYGRNNDYTSHCVQTWPDRFAGVGLLVGYRLFSPHDGEQNVERLEKLATEDGLAGLRLSPIYDRDVQWLDDPDCDALWSKAAELKCVFNIFLAAEQIPQLERMAERHPGVAVVVDHMAMIDITRPDKEGIEPLLRLQRLPNVYSRTSLHNPSKQPLPFNDVWPYLKRLYDGFGPHRLLWANFYEYLIMRDMIPFFTDQDRALILGETANRLYFERTGP
ncbi:MAG: amidohydrolase family protein [Candidatus Latescibacteria bacterium]|jgi:predicted TIM-barrel fold metal-dependent hydrolase|nr:amidohydrolase family protein [Candidatus Latescibacterota bacterium]